MDSSEQLKFLSEELNLFYALQDWGIINSSADRVNEFISYFDKKKDIQNSTEYHVFELIVASFNDAIIEKKNTEELDARFSNYVQQNSEKEAFKLVRNYWKSIEGLEYPVGKLL